MSSDASSTPADLSIEDALKQIKTKEFSAEKAVAALIEKADAGAGLNAIVTRTDDRAEQQAAAADERIQAGEARALEGLPIAVKDNFCTQGVRTTAASKILEDFTPTYESHVTGKLWAQGGVLFGKTNMDEFGMGSSTTSTIFGPTRNPAGQALGLDDLVAGGSSGGSAAAVAAGLCLGAIGTDTGGSIRQPASFCGVVGMKPTYGVCSRWGIIAYASSLDQAGPIARSAKDAWALLSVMAGEDPMDSTSAPIPKAFAKGPRWKKDMKGARIGLPRQFLALDCDAAACGVWDKAREAVEALGGEVVEVDLKHLSHALAAYYVIVMAEASSNLARYDGVRYGTRAKSFKTLEEMYENSRREGFSEEVRSRILAGTFALSSGYYDAYYERACRVRALVREDFKAAFQSCDALVWPTTPAGAFEIGARQSDPIEMYKEDVFTVPVNLAGLPAISLPFLKDGRGMPMGLTVCADAFEDVRVLELAHALEAGAAI